MYDFKVKWCPLCNQGWVEIVKDEATNSLYLCCSECETEWNNPEMIFDDCGTRDYYTTFSQPSINEIKEIGWDKYIIDG